MATRYNINDFGLANPAYVGATVSFWTVSGGAKTATLATLYAAATGSTTLTNPRALDSDGKFAVPVYVEVPVIATVSGLTVADHDTGIMGLAEMAASASATAAAVSAAAALVSQSAAGVSAAAALVSENNAAATLAAALPKVGGTMTGDLTMGAGRVVIFEGTTDDAFETTLAVADPTADRTITLPNASGTVALTSDITSGAQIQPISASVGASALTISASALSLDFRSAMLTRGAVTTVSGTPANLVISSGSTLGTVSATQSRIAVIAMNNAGTIELAAVNVAGLVDLSETGVISTTAEGGAGGADSASVIYSTTARSNLAYRVIGYLESTQATAGTWATAPSTIQGAGGRAMLPQGITLAVPVASTSGTSIDFTGIPSTAKRITVNFKGVSTSGTSNLILQIGDSGGVENTGYLGGGLGINAAMGGTGANLTDGFPLDMNHGASSLLHGSAVLSLESSANNTWCCLSILSITTATLYVLFGSGSKSLSAVLDRVRVTTQGGTDTFDAGEINISYE